MNIQDRVKQSCSMHAFRVIVLRLTAKWHVDESLIFVFTGHRDHSAPSKVYVTQNSNSSRETEEAWLLDPYDREVCNFMERRRSHFLTLFSQ